MSVVGVAVLVAALAQDASVGLDPASLALDELLARLPRIEDERIPGAAGDASTLDPLTLELGRRLRAGVALTSEQWRRVLVDTGTLCVPPRWVAGEPFAVTTGMPGWLDLHTVLIVEPLAPELRRARVGSFDLGSCGLPWMLLHEELARRELGILAPGRHRLELRLELRRAEPGETWFGLHPWLGDYLDRVEGSELGVPASRSGPRRMPARLSTAELSFDVEIVPTLDEAVPPVTTPALDEAVRLSLGLIPGEAPDVWFLAVEPSTELEHVALSLELQLVNLGRVVTRVRSCPTCAGVRQAWLGRFHEIEVPVLTRALQRGVDPGTWTVRVQGTADGVLHPCVDRRWAGTIELTVDELLARGAGRARR